MQNMNANMNEVSSIVYATLVVMSLMFMRGPLSMMCTYNKRHTSMLACVPLSVN